MSDQWQELKETITELRDSGGTWTQHEVCKFLVNYMGVLEKEMKGQCKDAISRGVFEQVRWERDVAIDQLKELGYGLGEKPKTGHWIWEHDEHYGTDIKTCSECGASYQHFDFTNYCPNCGKRMIR